MLKEVLTELTFGNISKGDAINIMNNSSLIDKIGVFMIFFLLYIKNE